MTDARRGTVDLSKQAEGTVNMWQEILREAMSQKELEDANIFIFGDKQTGKKSLIKVISKDIVNKDTEESKKTLVLDESAIKYGMIDYTYLNVRKLNEQDSESMGKMGVWIVNDIIDKKLFLSLIKPECLIKCICFIVVDLSRPSLIKDSIKKWTSFIYEAFSELLLKFKFDKQQEIRRQIEDQIKLYEEPQFDEEGNYKKEPLTEEAKDIKLQLALKEGVLKTNCGVPIGIIVNKSDIISQPNCKKIYEESSDFILKHVRQSGMGLGATIIYVSAKQNLNLSVLYDYICYRLFGFDLCHKPNLADKEMYFIPAGYDSLTALINSDTQKHLDTLYEMKFPPAKVDLDEYDKEEICEDTNIFLAKLKTDKDKKPFAKTTTTTEVDPAKGKPTSSTSETVPSESSKPESDLKKKFLLMNKMKKGTESTTNNPEAETNTVPSSSSSEEKTKPTPSSSTTGSSQAKDLMKKKLEQLKNKPK